MNTTAMNAPVSRNSKDVVGHGVDPQTTTSTLEKSSSRDKERKKSSRDRSPPSIDKLSKSNTTTTKSNKLTSISLKAEDNKGLKASSSSSISKSKTSSNKSTGTSKTKVSISSKVSTKTTSTDGEQSEVATVETSKSPVTATTTTVPVSKSAVTSVVTDSPLLTTDTEIEDDEVRLAMEMALAAAQNPKMTVAEIRELVGERNKQVKIVNEFSQRKKHEEERKKQEVIEEAQKRWDEKREMAITWLQAKSMAVVETATQLTEAAVKQYEDMKLNAELSKYAEQIKNDSQTIELRKKIKVIRKVYKAHKLNGNRIETRHAFRRQRMEKRLLQICDKLNKTQKLFTHSSYNVQEYLKALIRASKKWRKKGTDEELMLEAQLCRNMHQMLALEKQKVKCKKNQREMKKYLQRCKGWLTDKKAFCEMNQMTLEATMHSMKVLYEDIIAKQDDLIQRLKESDEYTNVDLSDVDISHIRMPVLPSARNAERTARLLAMKGNGLNDSIKVKKDSVKSGQHMNSSRSNLDGGSFHRTAHDLYVTAHDDISVCSGLSDPDEPLNNIDSHIGVEFPISMIESNNKAGRGHGGGDGSIGSNNYDDSDSKCDYGNDAPWMISSNASFLSAATDRKSLASCSLMKSMIPPDVIEEDDDEDNVIPTSKATSSSRSKQKSTDDVRVDTDQKV
jgi:hypothetical protein